ncbi:MAG TPA: imidazolonepropionase [Bosea sp. (in: a-proteobacteria)]|jgi:imidazolonepropionase|uniref:imidazolonepropionase n=1 Tax=Bosea sp. (in: a-proteobacteria) TaxID=1871050 RepID=UPI002DDCEC63|nr:imidazolonepropionase [Bosea sp. (in: a-proteobacteria)]HEV2554055.1 imidazolonepropionase [Bosea sp. (in: a-proteobacteria)]
MATMSAETPTCDRLWTRARLATMAPSVAAPYGAVDDGVVAARGGRILYAGPRSEAPAFAAAETIDCGGRWITPGLIDCHTHLVYGGDRAHEFELRLQGASYEEIARAGGGILSTVTATRAASEDALFASADRRLSALLAEGVTTVEIKSGYGLETQAEVKTLRVARRIGRERPVRVRTTFLGAHAVPPEFKGRSGDYTALVAGPMLDAIAAEGLADAVDVFCEGIAFSPDETRAVFKAAQAKGLAIKIHAEQLSNLGGAALAAGMGALSADHLEYLDEAGVIAMAKAGTVAVVLPGAFYFLRETQKPPIALLRRHGVAIALATDANPGSSPLTSPLLVMNMACTLFRLTPEEALAGLTRHAAQALGLQDEIGTLEAGKACDLAIWDIERPAELAYRIGFNPLHARIWNGQ